MKVILALLCGLFLLLQYKLWFEGGSVGSLVGREREIAELKRQNSQSLKENLHLRQHILALKTEPQVLEEQARLDLNMIKYDETYYQLIDGEKDDER